MKTTILFSITALVMSSSFSPQVSAKPIFGKIEKYINVKTRQVIEIGTRDISEDQTRATYYDYAKSKRLEVNMSDLSKITSDEIAGVRMGERALATTLLANSKTETVSRFCEVFYVFENKMAYIGCKATEADQINGYATPNRFDFIVNNVENIIAEVEALDGYTNGQVAELRIDTKHAKAGRSVKILAIFVNGEALIQKFGFSVLDSSGVLHKTEVERVFLSDLNKLQ